MPKANEHVVVIGGTSGIGLALARAAQALGCQLTVSGRGAERVAEIAKSIGPGVTGRHVELDDPASIRAGFTEGPAIDHLVLVPIDQLATNVKNFDVAAANKAVHVKLTGYIELVHTVLPRLKPTSSIVLFSGLAKAQPYPNATMISVVNAGIIGMMRTLAVELASLRYRRERVAAHQHGLGEIVLRGVDVTAVELVLVGKRHRMDQEVDRAPGGLHGGEHLVDGLWLGDIAMTDDDAADLLGQRLDALLEHLALIGEGKRGAVTMASFGDAPGQRAVVCDPHDQAALAAHEA